MTEESRTTNPAASIHVDHWCCVNGCGKWGGFGFSRSRGEAPTWWCSEHYPHKPNQVWDEAAAIVKAIITATKKEPATGSAAGDWRYDEA